MLYVPASRPDMIEKAVGSAADSICLDLEDSVAPAQKASSRENIILALRNLDFGDRTRMLRINGLDTPYAYRDIVEIVEAVGDALDVIMLPKTQRASDILFVDTLLSQIELNKGISKSIGIEAQIETATGFLWIREIAQSSERLEALSFGSGDYAASMRMPLTSIGAADEFDQIHPGYRWQSIMHAIVAAARSNGLRCMDGPYGDFRDGAGLERACLIAKSMGFDGKHCIHPAQLETSNQIFAPSQSEIEWAQEIEQAYRDAESKGSGVISVNNRMIDAANIRIAKSILKRRQIIENKGGKTNDDSI